MHTWHYVGLILQEQWNHFKPVLTAKTVEIYINDQLQHSVDGSFGAKSYLGFRDYGLCMGPVVNYLDNITITLQNPPIPPRSQVRTGREVRYHFIELQKQNHRHPSGLEIPPHRHRLP